MARRRDRGLPPPVGPPGVNPNPGGYMSEDHQWEGNYNRRGRGVSNRVSGNSATRTRRNRNCCDGWEHQMRGGQWMCGSYHGACEGQMHRGTHMGNNQDSVDVIWPWPSTPPDGPIIPPVLSTGGGHTGNQGHDVNVIWPWPNNPPDGPIIPPVLSTGGGNTGQGWCNTHSDCPPGMSCNENGQCIPSNPGPGPMPGGNGGRY